MRRKSGLICLIIGAILLASAAGLLAYNTAEDGRAGDASDYAVQLLEAAIGTGAGKVTVNPEDDSAMPTMEIDGKSYIGYISIPRLEKNLPVMADWSYSDLKIAPCRYSGSYKSDDLVIAGHNYKRHFGRLKRMRQGDAVTFTDAIGGVHNYTVVSVETLGPYQVSEMTESEYDLSLFSCTYGGQTRVTVRCMRSE